MEKVLEDFIKKIESANEYKLDSITLKTKDLVKIVEVLKHLESNADINDSENYDFIDGGKF